MLYLWRIERRNRTNNRMKNIFVGWVSALVIFAGMLSLASCGGSTNPLTTVCGPELTVEVGQYGNVVLTPASPNFYLATPHTAGSHCEAVFTLEWEWADSARCVNDHSIPKLISTYSPYHVNADNIWFDDITPTHDSYNIKNHPGNSYGVLFADSDHTDSASTCVYYIKFSSSGGNADSIRVHARIDYHEPQ